MDTGAFADEVVEQVEEKIDGLPNDECVDVLQQISDRLVALLRSFGVDY